MNRNIEVFLQTIDAARPRELSPALLQAALGKDRSARDVCFAQVASLRNAEWRAAIRRCDPAFDCVIRYVACLAAYEPWPPW